MTAALAGTTPATADLSDVEAGQTYPTAQTLQAVDVALDPAAAISGTITTRDGATLGGVRMTSDQFARWPVPACPARN